MKVDHLLFALILLIIPSFSMGQSVDDAKKWYLEGNFRQAKPVFEAEYQVNPNNAPLNQWLGVIAFTEGDYPKAQKHLEFASQKRIPESYLYLGRLYANMYRFADADKEFAKYEKANRRNKEALAQLATHREYADKLKRLINRTEDIQIIDSLVVPKSDFLSAYKLSASAGSLQPMSRFFRNQPNNNQVLFLNERQDKIYYPQNDSGSVLGSSLYTMEKLMDTFGNEKRLSESVNQNGDQAYPFVMPDGLTLYFSSTGHGSLGGYDLFVTRYNLATNTYLTPNQLNMPFNSPFNDYMMAIDEEKGIGWFASDRFQPKDSVCVYTFIPSSEVTLLESEDEPHLANRAKISSIKDSWKPNVDYAALLQRSHATTAPQEAAQRRDFTFVINDEKTYYTLSDFKNKVARSLYYQAIQLENKLERLESDLSEKRNQIASSSNTSSSGATILDLEKECENVFKEIESLKFRARNEEIRNSF
ncbi:tetratricopeptide repeat protein [Petrimonas sp.]|uniref:tetratricopeptide repeat protein n=1 Tax=Petrimonas sp. TaxID=2023866 RepID=UPI002B3AAE2A|nr:tetratricopeptide repeat protein [Petrimonas sp.]